MKNISNGLGAILTNLALGSVMAAFAPLPALAVLSPPDTPYTVITFTGTCSDCFNLNSEPGREVSATLTLQNYAPGSGAVSNSKNNFYSLVYGGSNLFEAFNLNSDSTNLFTDFYGGGFAAGSGVMADVYVTGNDMGLGRVFFQSDTSGGWRLGYGSGAADDEDFGFNGIWQVTQVVPEPDSLWLTGLALVALAAATRRRKALA